MNVTKNGIPIDNPRLRIRNATRGFRNDFKKFEKFATMSGFEDSCFVTETVPLNHPDFKRLMAQGYRVIDVWKKGEIA